MHQPLFEHFYEQYRQAAQTGMDVTDLHALDFRHRDFELHKNIRRSAAEFAAAKVMDLTRIMHDAPSVAGANLKAYLRYTETEKRLVSRSARQALNWQEIQRESDLFPMLRYITANDARVRDSHRILHGVTLPIDDPFWRSWYPPNGWGCRCAVQQIHDSARIPPAALPTEKEAPEELRFNAGITQTVVSDKHPYYTRLNKGNDKAKVKSKIEHRTKQAMAKLDISDLVYLHNDIRVNAHPSHGDIEFPANMETAKRLAHEGIGSTLLPIAHEYGVVSPDMLLSDGRLCEVKNPTEPSINAVRKNLTKAGRQNAEIAYIIAMDVTNADDLAKAVAMTLNLKKEYNSLHKLKEVWVYYKGKRNIVDVEKYFKGNYKIAFK